VVILYDPLEEYTDRACVFTTLPPTGIFIITDKLDTPDAFVLPAVELKPSVLVFKLIPPSVTEDDVTIASAAEVIPAPVGDIIDVTSHTPAPSVRVI